MVDNSNSEGSEKGLEEEKEEKENREEEKRDDSANGTWVSKEEEISIHDTTHVSATFTMVAVFAQDIPQLEKVSPNTISFPLKKEQVSLDPNTNVFNV